MNFELELRKLIGEYIKEINAQNSQSHYPASATFEGFFYWLEGRKSEQNIHQ